MRKFRASDFADVRFHRVDDNITRERIAEHVNELVAAEIEKAEVVYCQAANDKMTGNRFTIWDGIKGMADTHKGRLIYVEKIK